MKGTLYKLVNTWILRTEDKDFIVHPSQIDELQPSILTMISNEKRKVEYEIVKEYGNDPSNIPAIYAKIKNT